MGSAGINAKRRCFGHLPKESGVCSRSFPDHCASFPTLARSKSAGESRHSKPDSGVEGEARERHKPCGSQCDGPVPLSKVVLACLRGQSGSFGDAKHQVQTLNCHAGRALAEVVEPCREQHVAGYVGKNTK